MDHAWNGPDKDSRLGDYKPKHRQEFLDKGIRTQAELREIVTNGLEDKDTRAFRAQPSIEQGKSMSRELYGIPLVDNNQQKYELVVILNPDMKNGRLLGGTCFVPPDPLYLDGELKTDIKRLQQISSREITREDVMVMGGRPALREQDSRSQIVEFQPQQSTESLLERIERERKERGQISLGEVGKDRSQQREQERGI